MRVIAGKARHIPLETIPGTDTRPTTDRIKETLFNMIQYDLADSYFLDLFAGSGAIGIEALSRGAREAAFVEQSQTAAACIRKNLEKTRLAASAKLLVCDVVAGIYALENEGKVFDVIFMDPPYDNGLEKKVLEALRTSRIVYANTKIIVEASLATDFSFADDLGFEVIKEKNYKTNKHVFLKRK